MDMIQLTAVEVVGPTLLLDGPDPAHPQIVRTFATEWRNLDKRIPLFVGRRSATMRPPLPAGCFQDAEGKVPVTTVEQPVGLVRP